MAALLPDEVWVCPVCWAGDPGPGDCEHKGAQAHGMAPTAPRAREGPFVRPPDPDEWVGLTVVANELDVTRQTVVDWINKGYLPAERSSPNPRSAYRIKRDDMEQLRGPRRRH